MQLMLRLSNNNNNNINNKNDNNNNLIVLVSEMFRNPQNQYFNQKFKKFIKQMLNIIYIIVDDINQHNITNNTIILISNHTSKIQISSLNIYTQITLLYTFVKKIYIPTTFIAKNTDLSTDLIVTINLFYDIMKIVNNNKTNEFLQLTIFSIITKICDYYGEDFTKFIKIIISEGSTYYSLTLEDKTICFNQVQQHMVELFKYVVSYLKESYLKKYKVLNILDVIRSLINESNFVGVYTAFNDIGLLEYEDVIRQLIGKVSVLNSDKVIDLLVKFNNRKLLIIYYAMRGKIDKLNDIISQRIKLSEDEFSYILVTLHPTLIQQSLLGSNEFTHEIIKKFYNRSNYLNYFFDSKTENGILLTDWYNYFLNFYDLVFQTNYIPYPTELDNFLNLKINYDEIFYSIGEPHYRIKWNILQKFDRDRRLEEITNKLLGLGCIASHDIFKTIISLNIKLKEDNIKKFSDLNILESEDLTCVILAYNYDITPISTQFTVEDYKKGITKYKSFRYFELLSKYIKPTKEIIDFINGDDHKYIVTMKVTKIIKLAYEKGVKI
jgi:hypothetical protein